MPKHSAKIQFKPITFTAGEYTLLEEDIHFTLVVNEATDVVINVPDLPTMLEGSFINVKQIGVGKVTFVQDSTIINSLGSSLTTSGPGAYVSLIRVDSGEYDLVGALEQPATYKKYVALLEQSGTNDPTVTVLENTLEGDITWTRSNLGIYFGTLVGLFTNPLKVWYNIAPTNVANHRFILTYDGDPDYIYLAQVDINNTGTNVDGFIGPVSIEIRVYP